MAAGLAVVLVRAHASVAAAVAGLVRAHASVAAAVAGLAPWVRARLWVLAVVAALAVVRTRANVAAAGLARDLAVPVRWGPSVVVAAGILPWAPSVAAAVAGIAPWAPSVAAVRQKKTKPRPGCSRKVVPRH